jgi:HEAT repeat protein
VRTLVTVCLTSLSFSLAACQAAAYSPPATKAAQKESPRMNSVAHLQALLEAANWDAVDEAQREGASALPVIRRSSQSQNYRTRQISVACAARIGGKEATDIISAGLKDPNVNVQLQAAKELSSGKFPSAGEAILSGLSKSRDVLVREFLALAAGYIPGSRTVATLRPLAESSGTLASDARMALARLGDVNALSDLTKSLESPVPRMRYEALDQLRYVANPKLVPYARRLLDDREPARRIGPARHPRFRRVCDQAVDTLVFLLNLHPAFPVAPERIYSDEELAQIRGLAK